MSESLNPDEICDRYDTTIDELKAAASELYTLLKDIGIPDQYPVQLTAFREAFGIEEKKEPLGIIVPGRRISLPVDDGLYLLVRDYKKFGQDADLATQARKTVKAQIVGPMGEAAELAFHDGTTAVRRQVTRKAHTVQETTYEELRVNWRGPV